MDSLFKKSSTCCNMINFRIFYSNMNQIVSSCNTVSIKITLLTESKDQNNNNKNSFADRIFFNFFV